MRPVVIGIAAAAILVCVCLQLKGSQSRQDGASQGFLENPFHGSAEAVLAGKKLFKKNCSHCHGEDGRGLKKAKNLRQPEIQNAQPAALFEWIRNGNLRAGMPAWSHLPDQRIWQLVIYIQNMGSDGE